MPKFLGWFESVLERNPTGTAHLVGARLSYADLSLFQLVEGLRYAFPNAMDALGRDIPGVLELAGRIGQRRNIAAYLASPRRQPFTRSQGRRVGKQWASSWNPGGRGSIK